MSNQHEKLKKRLQSAEKEIKGLETELEETNRGMVSLALELEKTRERFEDIFRNAIEGIFQISSDGKHFLLVNSSLANLLGYDSPEMVKERVNNISEEVFVNTDQYEKLLKKLEENEQDVIQEEFKIRKKGGKEIWVILNQFLVTREHNGHSKYYEGTIIDIDKRKRYEEQIKASVKEKEVLLAEIHHRVKNNLALISSLLELEFGNIDHEGLKDVLDNSKMRIKAIANVHENIYETEDFKEIDFQSFITKLIEEISKLNSNEEQNVSVHLNIKDIGLNVNQAVPFALLLNELLTNSYKHAFKDRQTGRIEICLKKEGKNILFTYKDDGVGIPENVDVENPSTLGLQLLNILTKQLQAETIHESGSEGTLFRIKFEYETEKMSFN